MFVKPWNIAFPSLSTNSIHKTCCNQGQRSETRDSDRFTLDVPKFATRYPVIEPITLAEVRPINSTRLAVVGRRFPPNLAANSIYRDSIVNTVFRAFRDTMAGERREASSYPLILIPPDSATSFSLVFYSGPRGSLATILGQIYASSDYG